MLGREKVVVKFLSAVFREICVHGCDAGLAEARAKPQAPRLAGRRRRDASMVARVLPDIGCAIGRSCRTSRFDYVHVSYVCIRT